MGKGSKKKRTRERLFDHEAIIADISQKSMQLKDVQSDLQLQKSKWASLRQNPPINERHHTNGVVCSILQDTDAPS